MSEILQLVTPPDEDLPISLSDLKEHLRVTHEDDDNYINDLAWTAYNWIESEADITILPTIYKLTLDHFPRKLYLPKPPILTVDEVTYFDQANEEQTVEPEDYYLLAPMDLPAFIQLKTCVTTYCRPDSVNVTFTAGYSGIPYQIPHLMRLLVATMYEIREGEITGTITKKTELGVDRLLNQIRNTRY